MKNKIIIGLDPGSINFGYGVLKCSEKKIIALEYGAVKCNVKMHLKDRVSKIYEELNKIFKKHKPQVVSIEDIFYHKNVKSAVTLAHSRAAGILLCANFNCELAEYSPRKIKLAITGRGGADKEQVQKMVCSILNISEKDLTLDTSDALAIALCYYFSLGKPTAVNLKNSKNKWDASTLKNSNFKIVGGT